MYESIKIARNGGFFIVWYSWLSAYDAAIASIAMKYGIPVWANDKHFEMMKSVIPQLKVYRTEELI